jgi:hypothetical protein
MAIAGELSAVGCGIQERSMSVSVNSSSNNNAYAYLQYLQQQGTSLTGSGQTNPLDALLTALGQGTGTSSSTAGATSPAATTSGNSSPQFGPQTLQALFAMQANAANQGSLWSQFGAQAGTDDQASGQQVGQTAGHHHHHRGMDALNGASFGGENPLQALASANAGATSQTTSNANGSATTTINYADGSSVTMTTAPPSNNPSSSASATSSAGGANVTSNNLLEQLIQMQAQLLNPTTTQSIATV